MHNFAATNTLITHYMKNFLKIVLGTIVGLVIFSILSTFVFFGFIGTIASIGETKPIVYPSSVMTIDMSKIVLTEQTKELDVLSMMQGKSMEVQTLGIYSAVRSINAAAADPSIAYIYMKPDATNGGTAQIEELREALENFRVSGKAVVSYIENPTNAGVYLASVSDKVYMTPYNGITNMFTGVSSQMVFLKDLLENLGINVQLIRHGKYKSAGEMFINSTPSKENLEQNKALIASVWNTWSETIADARELTTEDLNAMLNNLELCFPEDFLDKGLVDGLATREEMRERLALLAGAKSADEIKAISICDYARATAPKEPIGAQPKIAVIFLDGEIVDGDQMEQVAGDRFAKIIADIRKDPAVKAAVLRVNSPGGSVLAAEKILAEVELLQAQMPVIASYGAYAASGGYWISAGCDKIYTNATTLTGSIGVFSMIPDFQKTLKKKLHVGITNVNSNEHSDMYGLMRPLDGAEVKYMQKSVEKIYERFTGLVAEGRSMTVADVDNIAQGRVWSGSDAVALNLADEIGTLEDAIDWAISSIEDGTDVSDIAVASYPKPMTGIETLLEQLQGGQQNILSDTPFATVGEAFGKWRATEGGKAYARMPFEYIIR